MVHICVGDVSGKGIQAATVMSRKRRTFEIYAHDLASPAEIVRRMLRHVDGQEMVTLTIVSLDLYTGELTYTRVGHPPRSRVLVGPSEALGHDRHDLERERRMLVHQERELTPVDPHDARRRPDDCGRTARGGVDERHLPHDGP